MARCGCTPKCNCVMQNGACTKVALTITPGTCGDSTSKFKFNIVPDGVTVFCGANGLSSPFQHVDTNTVQLIGAGTAGSPLEAHVIRTPDANVPGQAATGTGNLIKELPGAGGGIYVSCEDIQDCVGAAIDVNTADCLDYDDTTNTISIKICGEPNGLECAPVGNAACPAGGLLVTPSSDANNALTFGTDGRLYDPAVAVQPGPCMTFTGSGTVADPFVISPMIAPEQNGVECVPGSGLLVAPSSDANNNLVFGGDTRLWVNKCPLSVGASQVLVGNTGPCFEFVGGGCGVPMVATLRLSDDVCQGLVCGNDGLYIQVDQTNLPNTVQQSFNFGPLGPFNGNILLPGQVVVAPVCITMTNPSPCRSMVTSGTLSGFAEIGRTAGEFRAGFDISTTGNLAGPWFTVSQVGTGAPEPSNRYTGNALWGGDEFVIGPGGTRSICTRVQVVVRNGNNARIFSGQATLSLVGKWVN